MAEKGNDFSSSVQNVKLEVSEYFDKIIAGLTTRKEELLAALDELNKFYSEKLQQCYDHLEKLDNILAEAEQKFKLNFSLDRASLEGQKELHQQQKASTKARIAELEGPIEIVFEYKYKVNEFVDTSGNVKVKGEYDSFSKFDKPSHLIKISVQGMTQGDSQISLRQDRRKSSFCLDSQSFNVIDSFASLPPNLSSSLQTDRFLPSAITIDPNTSEIYAIDSGVTPKVLVFTSEGVLSNEIVPQLPKLSSSIRFYGISIARGRMYISSAKNGVIFAISLQNPEKTLYHSARGIFHSLSNLAVDSEDGEVFACDKGGMKIQTFSEILQFKKAFGDRLLQGPADVKVRNDRVIVLDNGDFALRFFTKKGVLLGENITFQPRPDTLFVGRLFFSGGKRVEFFDIDAEGNAYISDYKSGVIRKFDVFGGQVLQFDGDKSDPHSQSFQTKGIAIDKRGRVVSIKNTFCDRIQFFCAKTLKPCSS